MSSHYDLAEDSAGKQTRVKDCLAAKFGILSTDVDDAFIDSKQDEWLQNIVDTAELNAKKSEHTNTPL